MERLVDIGLNLTGMLINIVALISLIRARSKDLGTLVYDDKDLRGSYFRCIIWNVFLLICGGITLLKLCPVEHYVTDSYDFLTDLCFLIIYILVSILWANEKVKSGKDSIIR